MEKRAQKLLTLAFSLDRRSLAVMRVAYGFLILTDLLIRSVSFEEHYGRLGAFPVTVAFEMGLQPTNLSLHVLNGTTGYQGLLFLLHAFFALMLLLGWRTRLFTILCFVMAVSLQNRNFLILNGGDNWMRLVLFWAIFLPWGDRWSLDSLKNRSEEVNFVSNVASFGLLTQVMIVYFVSALYKTGPAWRTEGSAIYLALHQLEWNSDLGTYFLYFPNFLMVLSFAIMLYELIGPWLLICPCAFGPVRTFSTLAFIGFHFGLEVCMELGVFPLVGMCTLLGLFPAWAWERFPLRSLGRALDWAYHPRSWNRRLVEQAGSSEPLTHWVTPYLLWLVALFTLTWNMSGRQGESFPLPQSFKVAGQLMALNQYWGLFAPEPGRTGGWLVLEAQLSDGSVIDLQTNQAIDWSPPRSSSVFPTQRVKRWWVGVTNEDYKAVRPYVASWLVRRWRTLNKRDSLDIERVRGHWVSRKTLPNFEDSVPTKYVFLDYSPEELGL